MTWEEWWDDTYSHIIACTGWTWEYIDDFMTLPRFDAMQKYWRNNPPVHILLRDFFGVGKASDKSDNSQSSSQGESKYGSLEDLISDFSAAGGKVNL